MASCPTYDSQQGHLLSACFAHTWTKDALPGPLASSDQGSGSPPALTWVCIHPRQPHHSPEAAGTAAKLLVPVPIHPSAPVSLLLSRALVFNDHVCFRSRITSFGNISRVDGRASPHGLPLPVLTLLHIVGYSVPPQLLWGHRLTENQHPRKASSSCMVPPNSLTCPCAGCGGQNAP